MNTAAIFLFFFFSAVAIVSASPFMYVADQFDPTGATTWSGFSMAYVTQTKGTMKYRVRVFGENNINTSVSSAFLGTLNGTMIARLNTSTNGNANIKYVLGSAMINSTVWQWMKMELVAIFVVSNNNNRYISGIFVSRPNMGISFLSPGSVVGATVNSSATGFGGIYVYSVAQLNAIFNGMPLPVDLGLQDAASIANYGVYGRIIQNTTNATGATWNGLALPNATAPALAFFGTVGSAFFANFTISSANATFAPYFIGGAGFRLPMTYLTIQTVANPNGELRGTVYPLVGLGRRKIPTSVTLIAGSTTGILSSLKRAAQVGFANHRPTYVSCNPLSNTFQAIFNFPMHINKRNVDGVRGFQMEFNIRGQNQTYFFEMFNSLNASWIPIGSFNGANTWSALFALYNKWDAANFINAHGILQVRVTSSTGQGKLLIDLFGVRVYHARFVSSQYSRILNKLLQHLPSQ